MPLLLGILVLLAIWAGTLDGAGAGYSYYLAPDFGALSDPRTIADAAGQAYFSLSLGMGALITFASYMGKGNDLGKESAIVAFADFAVAFIAGMVVFPVVFALGFDNLVIGLGPTESEGVLFIALPAAFQSMGALGRLLGVVFFFALSVAALTSTISLLEVVVSSVIDEFKIERKKAALIVGAGIAVTGLAPAYDSSVIAIMNSMAGDLALGVGVFATVIIVGWLMEDPVAELEQGASQLVRATLPMWYFGVRFVLPIITGTVLFLMVRTKFFAG